MKKLKLKKRKHYKFKIFVIIFFLIIITSLYYISIMSKNVDSYILDSAELKLKRYSLAIINSSTNEALKENIDIDKLFNVTSNNNTIEMIDFNPVVVNNILSVVTSNALLYLKQLESGNINMIDTNLAINSDDKKSLEKGIITYVPLGTFFKVSLLSNIGPKIPVRLHYTGDINSNISTKLKSYGINNVLLEIDIHIEVTAQILLPLSTKLSTISTEIPIAIKMIQGKIPSYYSGGGQNSESYSLPIN